MSLKIVRLGSPRTRGEGLRIGTVRRPPRGVPKSRYAADDWYDTWLPALSPSPALVKLALAAESPAQWNTFVKRFKAEMNKPEAAHLLDLFAALSHTAHFSIGCYCENEERCHRSVLRELLAERKADIV